MSEKTGFLEELPGKSSQMRLQSFLAFLASIPFAYLELKAGVPFPYFTTMFLTAAFVPKALQKFAESKTG